MLNANTLKAGGLGCYLFSGVLGSSARTVTCKNSPRSRFLAALFYSKYDHQQLASQPLNPKYASFSLNHDASHTEGVLLIRSLQMKDLKYYLIHFLISFLVF